MATKTISSLTEVTAANLDDTAVVPVDDKNADTRKATVAQLRTQILTGVPSSGFAKIAEAELASAAATITATNVGLHMRFNNSAVGYDSRRAHTAGTIDQLNDTEADIGQVPTGTANAGRFSKTRVVVFDYVDGGKMTGWLNESNVRWDDVTAGNTHSENGGGDWRTMDAVNRIDLFMASGNFVAGTIATLYGMS
jgi:hypothetical protein